MAKTRTLPFNVDFAAHLAAAHKSTKGSHTHAHPAYGAQGGDQAHEHMHSHNNDANHGHDHGMQVPAVVVADGQWPAGQMGFVAAGTVPPADAEPIMTLVAASMTQLGSGWGVGQEADDKWTVLGGDEPASFPSYGEAVGFIGERLREEFAATTRPVLTVTWRSDMAFEDVDTGDGRYIQPGAIGFRDCPLPLMLQTHTDYGHFGAVLAGTITACGKMGNTAIGRGEFDDSDAGRQFQQVIEARGRFGVSIDVAEAEGEFECTERDIDGDCVDGRVSFSLIVVMGVTGTPFPAFADAYIELESAAQTASGSLCHDCPDGSWTFDNSAGSLAAAASTSAGAAAGVTVWAQAATPEPVLAAAGGPLVPPAAWFGNPGFEPGDGRMVLQIKTGGYACPHTITADGHVFGHMWAAGSCHTAYADSCVPPPRSPSGYANFLTGALPLDDGTIARVGQLTMGVGHADTNPRLDWRRVKAHYDGGPGAVPMADVTCGEDAYGCWYSGALRPDVTPEQVRAFAACGVSGDWRTIPGVGVDLLACAAGIISPGFPIERALAAAGYSDDDVAAIAGRIPEARAHFIDGKLVSLVAAGVVRQPLPWERALGALAEEISRLSGRLKGVENVTAALGPMAAAAYIDEIGRGVRAAG